MSIPLSPDIQGPQQFWAQTLLAHYQVFHLLRGFPWSSTSKKIQFSVTGHTEYLEMPLSTRCFLEECGRWRASCLLHLSPSSCPQEMCSSANRKLNQGTESSTRASKNSTLWRKAQWDKGEQGGRDVPSLRPWARPINPIHALRRQWKQEQGLAVGCPQPGFPQRLWDHLRPK